MELRINRVRINRSRPVIGLPQNFGRWRGPMNGTLALVVGILSGGGETQILPYAKNLFKLFALTGMGIQTFRMQALAPEPPGGISTT